MRRASAIVPLLLITFAAAPARAQGVGGRVGASVTPDQFYAGAHFETAELVERLRFRPNVEVGLGSDLTLVAVNFEFTYRLPPNSPRLSGSLAAWHLYVGGGPALNMLHESGNTHWEGGFEGLFGLGHRDGLFVEAKLGALDSPRFKIGVGYTFK
jgi:hypothetical protein